jgi:hypothetical protein
MQYCVVLILVTVATLIHTDGWAQTGAVAPSDRRARPGGNVQAAVGSPAGAPAAVHVGITAGCSLPPCVTTALDRSGSVAPALLYEKARLLGGGKRADYHVKLCVFPGASLSRCPAGGDVTYYQTPEQPMASLRDLKTIRFDGVSAVPGCFVLRWDKPEHVSTPFAIVATSGGAFPCAGR